MRENSAIFQGAIRCVKREEFPWRPPFTRVVWTFRLVRGELDDYGIRAVIKRYLANTMGAKPIVLLTSYGIGPEQIWELHFLIIKND